MRQQMRRAAGRSKRRAAGRSNCSPASELFARRCSRRRRQPAMPRSVLLTSPIALGRRQGSPPTLLTVAISSKRLRSSRVPQLVSGRSSLAKVSVERVSFQRHPLEALTPDCLVVLTRGHSRPGAAGVAGELAGGKEATVGGSLLAGGFQSVLAGAVGTGGAQVRGEGGVQHGARGPGGAARGPVAGAGCKPWWGIR